MFGVKQADDESDMVMNGDDNEAGHSRTTSLDDLAKENLILKKQLSMLAAKGQSVYASKGLSGLNHPEELLKNGLAPEHVLRYISDQNVLDFQPRLNTSSYVNVSFEKEELEVASMGMHVNLADQTVYPESYRLHNDCINMIGNLWHVPKMDDFEEYGCYAGAGTVGSTEACLLGGLCLKFRWRKWYAKKYNMSADQVLGVRPNLVISTAFQAAWEKFFKYMDVEARLLPTSVKTFSFDPSKIEEYIDDQTIGVVCIMGNHYGGHYDPVERVDEILQRMNEKTGRIVGIHVDAASGGFIAPFQDDAPKWDFRLPSVLSISASGHKFGQSVCGTGWIVWRQREGLSEHVAISVSYLGGKADSYTLNFSRPACGIYVQLYKLLRLGMDGYRQVTANQMETAERLRKHLASMKTPKGKKMFVIMDAAPKPCLPVVTAMVNPEADIAYDDIDLQHCLAHYRWYVSGYCMHYEHPNTGKVLPLFTEMPGKQTMFRVVVKSNLTPALMRHLIESFDSALKDLDSFDKGFMEMHPWKAKRKLQHIQNHPC